MNEEIYAELMRHSFDSDTAKKMAEYAALMLDQNKTLNLTRIIEPHEVAEKHFIDSVAAASLIPHGARVIDIGTGAGFPGVPLKIARPDIDITLMDSVAKKLDFVSRACEALGIEAAILATRAEEVSHDLSLRESYDIAISRAVAPLRILCELSLPFLKCGGAMIAYKGAAAQSELADANLAIKLLGGGGAHITHLSVGDTDHCAIVVKKTANTPKKYPRKYAQIKKQPL